MRTEGDSRASRAVLIVLAVPAVLAVLLIIPTARPGGSADEPSGRVLHVGHGREQPAGGAALERRSLPQRRDDIAIGGAGLRDTVVDGALPTAPDGHLIPAPDVIRFFGYFFVDSGELDDGDIRRRIEAEIDARLEEPARGEARALLEKYLTYRAAAALLFASGATDETVAARIAAIEELRRDAFGEETDSLFGSDLEYARVAAAIRDIFADPALSDEQRAARIAELEAQLPDDLRAARERAVAPLDLARDEARLRALGAGKGEIHALRAERFGQEAADRLAVLDGERAEWRARVDQFRRQRSLLEADPQASAEQIDARIEELLRESFSEPERRRVMALDSVELGR